MTQALPTETIRIGMIARGRPHALAFIKETMRHEEAMGWFRIIHIDDDLAVIQWTDASKARVLATWRDAP